MTETEIAWLSGWLEGEGYFGIGAGTPALIVNSTDLDVIQKATKLIAVGKLVQSPKPQKPHWKQQYRIQLYGENAATIMRLIRPYMGQRRGEAIDTALQLYAEIEARRKDRISATLIRKNKNFSVVRDGHGKFISFNDSL